MRWKCSGCQGEGIGEWDWTSSQSFAAHMTEVHGEDNRRPIPTIPTAPTRRAQFVQSRISPNNYDESDDESFEVRTVSRRVTAAIRLPFNNPRTTRSTAMASSSSSPAAEVEVVSDNRKIVRVFTDGSHTSGGTAGWALVWLEYDWTDNQGFDNIPLLSTISNQYEMLNSAQHSRKVEVQGKVALQDSPQWLGALTHTNNTAELTALVIALWRFYSFIKSIVVKQERVRWELQLISDSLFSLQAIMGVCATGKSGNTHALVRIGLRLMDLVWKKGCMVKCFHVFSHSETTPVCFNNRADSLARAAAIAHDELVESVDDVVNRWEL